MKKIMKLGLIYGSVAVLTAGCGRASAETEAAVSNATETVTETANETAAETVRTSDVQETEIVLSDEQITVDGSEAGTASSEAVYVANDIVYYEAGQGFTYGEGTEADEHTAEEADAHTVVHITKPGTYRISGKLSAGQIAVDLGEDAEEDPEAVVTLILDNADITCTVAPAVIFYEVYECGSTENASMNVDTGAAGANVIIADGSVNNINGSYVARIYKSYELNEAGTEVIDSKKLHKYDGAFYSKMSMNVYGGESGDGILNIAAENEGLDSERHLTVNGGNINITAGNDGINTNEDEVSVTTINGGTLNIVVDGSTGEGDGIDSNGWLVINGGTVIASACASSMDAGIDSDMGIHINGGTVIASGNMLDRISDSEQNFMVLSFAKRQSGGDTYTIKDENGNVTAECTPVNDFACLIYSAPELSEGSYTVWAGDTQLSGAAGESSGGPGRGGMRPDDGGGSGRPEKPDDAGKPEDMKKPDGTERPDGGRRQDGSGNPGGQKLSGQPEDMELSGEFQITEGGSYFRGVTSQS